MGVVLHPPGVRGGHGARDTTVAAQEVSHAVPAVPQWCGHQTVPITRITQNRTINEHLGPVVTVSSIP